MFTYLHRILVRALQPAVSCKSIGNAGNAIAEMERRPDRAAAAQGPAIT